MPVLRLRIHAIFHARSSSKHVQINASSGRRGQRKPDAQRAVDAAIEVPRSPHTPAADPYGITCERPSVRRPVMLYNHPVFTETQKSWEAFLATHPDAHLLQTPEWGALKAAFGWQAEHVQHGEAGAQILFRRPLPGFTLAYIPKGPIGPWLPGLLPLLDQRCRKRRCFMLKIEPDENWDPQSKAMLMEAGFTPAFQTIQPPRTIHVDLTPSEDEILANMKQKTRYNIRLASRRGVRVRAWSDLDQFAQMMAETAERDAFGAHSPAYYRLAYDLFHPKGGCELLVAEYKGSPLAAVMVFRRRRRAWYLYGASHKAHREKMPTYLLQWEAMRWAKQAGCELYDLWGIPDEEPETLEAQFQSRGDGLWGVYRFKRGFGGEVVRSIGAWDRIYDPLRYRVFKRLYTWVAER